MKKRFNVRLCLKIIPVLQILGMIFLFSFVPSSNLRADTITKNLRLNISVKNASIFQVLSLIKQQTTFNFIYNEEDINQLGNLNINLKDVDIITVLNKCVEGTSVTYGFMGDIVIFRNKNSIARDSVKNVIVKGSVKDMQGNLLPGVTVIVKRTKLGVTTDNNGLFKLLLPYRDSSTILVFSFIGMETKEVKVGIKKEIHVVLKDKDVNLEDVVVTGYANISRQSFTGNVKTVTATELKKISQTNILKALQVLDPSFRLATNNELGSNPNALPQISIRGTSGIGITELDAQSVSKTALQNDPNLPTFIMDGFEVNVSKLFDMDVNRIETITLLKDAAATAIYGSRAANGVVVITTIAPKSGEILLGYNYTLNLSIPDLRDYNLMDAREKVEAELQAGLFDDANWMIERYHEKLRLIERGQETDWMSQPLQNASNSKHYIRIEGGGSDLRFGIDVNYFGDKGVMKESNRTRTGINFEIRYGVKKLIFSNVAGFSGVNSDESPYGSFSQYTTMNPYYAFQDENGVMLKRIDTGEGSTILNPLYEATLNNFSRKKAKEFLDNFSVQYHITDKFYVKGNVALTYTTSKSEVFVSPEAEPFPNTGAMGSFTTEFVSALNLDGGLFAYYNDVINNHSLNVVAGVNMKESTDENYSNFVQDLPRGFSKPQYAQYFSKAPNAREQTSRMIGMMVSANYTYDNIYLVDITGRLDGHSSFGSASRFAPFWSGGLGMNIHKFSFFKELSWLSELKIRGSYGITGKANFPAKTARTVYTLSQSSVYPTGVGANIAAMGNRDLKWEKTKITDVGGTIGLFNNGLYLNGTYYVRRTVDLIADMYVASSSGFVSYKENVGEIVNKGFELSLRVKAFSNSNMQLYLSGSLATNKNRIDKLSDAMKAYNKMIENNYRPDLTGAKKPLIKFMEGASTSSIYAMPSLGIDPQTGQELFRYQDGSVNTEWLASENVAIGNSEPKWNGSFSMNLNYRGVTLDAYCMYTCGGQQYNETLQTKIENANLVENVDKKVFTERWKKPGDVTRFKSLKDYAIPTNPTSRFVQDDNTLTLQSISLGYELSQSLLKKQSLLNYVRFSMNMNDVFRISSIEQERGLAYPFARSYSFNVSVGF